jgi:hypothetical protein
MASFAKMAKIHAPARVFDELLDIIDGGQELRQ